MIPSLVTGSRQTLAAPTSIIEGIGLHSGSAAAIRVLPAPAGTGIVFRNLDTSQELPAIAAHVVETARCTLLQADDFTLQTVEHLLSALAGLEIDDAIIETSGGEIPAMDGSAASFVEALLNAGISVHHGSARTVLAVSQPVLVTGDNGSSLAVLPATSLQMTVVLDYPHHPYIGTQAATFEAVTGYYAEEIAAARTYGFRAEVAALQAHGLALGASEENAIALGEDHYETPLRFENELARHKLLDLIGDLSLVGCPLQAHVLAIKPSHALNARMAKILAASATPIA